MTLPSSGTITFQEINNEFTVTSGLPNNGLGYRISSYENLPISGGNLPPGPISFNNFYGVTNIYNTTEALASVPGGTIQSYSQNDHEGVWIWNGSSFVISEGEAFGALDVGLNPIFAFIQFLTKQAIPASSGGVVPPYFSLSSKYASPWGWATPRYSSGSGTYQYGDTYEEFIADFVNATISDLPGSTPLITYAKSVANSNVFNNGGNRSGGSTSTMLAGFNQIITWIQSNG